MAFPPEFSSTQKYANRYDLDEIDVFLEGDSNNPMFFDVKGLPKSLSFGKHYFNINLLNTKNQQYKIRQNSKILFEFKSINNVVLKSDVSPIKSLNGAITCFVEVLKDPLRTFLEVQDGEGTLNIVASLQRIDELAKPIPKKFENAINYRCTFPIDIRKNIINADSPFVLQDKHETKTTLGQFSFAKASISSRKTNRSGFRFNSSGIPSNQPAPQGSTK
tara:strand:- start:1549 stop:2205 length:657 start_codon:yes stop_codon:yes gene_type:complete